MKARVEGSQQEGSLSGAAASAECHVIISCTRSAYSSVPREPMLGSRGPVSSIESQRLIDRGAQPSPWERSIASRVGAVDAMTDRSLQCCRYSHINIYAI